MGGFVVDVVEVLDGDSGFVDGNVEVVEVGFN